MSNLAQSSRPIDLGARSGRHDEKKRQRGVMMTKDDLETFMRQWTKEHISVADLDVDPDDVLYAATLRSDSLTLLAAENGFYRALREKAAPYGGVVQYMMSLFEDAKRATVEK
jgi:hypothetical protein